VGGRARFKKGVKGYCGGCSNKGKHFEWRGGGKKAQGIKAPIAKKGVNGNKRRIFVGQKEGGAVRP